jgi:serine/threonine protein kinase
VKLEYSSSFNPLNIHWSAVIQESLNMSAASNGRSQPQAQIAPCRYKTGKVLGAGSYSVVKECVHIETGRYYAAKVINKRLMQGREHMVSGLVFNIECGQLGECSPHETTRLRTY